MLPVTVFVSFFFTAVVCSVMLHQLSLKHSAMLTVKHTGKLTAKVCRKFILIERTMLTLARTRHRKLRSCRAYPRRMFNQVAGTPRKYPIGISDWKEIKQENYFYWDRTKFVKEFYEDPGKVRFNHSRFTINSLADRSCIAP